MSKMQRMPSSGKMCKKVNLFAAWLQWLKCHPLPSRTEAFLQLHALAHLYLRRTGTAANWRGLTKQTSQYTYAFKLLIWEKGLKFCIRT